MKNKNQNKDAELTRHRAGVGAVVEERQLSEHLLWLQSEQLLVIFCNIQPSFYNKTLHSMNKRIEDVHTGVSVVNNERLLETLLSARCPNSTTWCDPRRVKTGSSYSLLADTFQRTLNRLFPHVSSHSC